mmetsp:Transcript_42149/g.65982  ORF Transcript_42149/g.65982 Transcript_42149/m.65982 type:complete len:87 (+) Transcript_42149:342-602(+)|eukprot:CAMPEP_0184289848 /NCGR_PEP_ID=MMETSP1049-20130417/2221_1 /TAXON_ID=77928 /ORGANISM="Proteomonas sulcata, Strain CCMP704" /LENGTH=86 /DNA_ID=CAMNT_0026596803 /DNA_START=329 /DNA_END=589 /DNA_ORIENTATION=+
MTSDINKPGNIPVVAPEQLLDSPINPLQPGALYSGPQIWITHYVVEIHKVDLAITRQIAGAESGRASAGIEFLNLGPKRYKPVAGF